ncbi:MarR family winged helix-turn-helix transcriptional regulator [Cryptosporangium arvum]|uniref:Transcriptional regulator n=1 Tax=Cryptosporangium arvum DSM 44712 TaxID=927661 RepID=A0A010YW36_9ACTN|nr:MarR family transcriptional regulator [Cryptosporangium arvum]EXG79348.1 transcriptional regulator [Cryptosporangium arvum DSM 44712]
MDRRERTRELGRELRRYFVEARLVTHAFAELHGLHATDLHALIEIMDAEGRGEPTTPGRLGEALGLSSGATTAVVDRLERLGHIRRERPAGDRRRVHLHYDEGGRELALEFFGPLHERIYRVVGEFTEEEVAVAHRFLTAVTDAAADHRRAVRDNSDRSGQADGDAAGRGGRPQADGVQA